ncbi:hypothetical protein PHYPSEUDO_014660 [Phytophthora pseudosyringae]|uniref:Uncharacterized protein n=1 Tax=Phytophthora pseudosyringae TaxID=221518 RepID=A0A8T1W4Q7_9STRA|nr:hypothetical protein PHYPSEUDO_014660 [Phytophthora pseudosyringae]
MSLLSSTMKMATSSEGSSSVAKIKRKSRRRRAMSPGASSPEELERPRERTHHSRRAHRDVPAVVSSNGEGGSSRRTPTHRHHSTLSSAAPSLVTSSSKRRPEQPAVSLETTMAARRTLTSSASSIRPSNRKRLEEIYLGEASSRRHTSGNNNGPEYDGDEQHSTSFGKPRAAGDEEDWLTGSRKGNNHAAARVALPSRASKYRNLSAGMNKKPRARPAAVPATEELSDRPPSRQKHAFPTHLIDTNAFDAPETTGRRGGSSSSSSSTSSARSSGRPTDPCSPSEGVTTDRPPSRYMVKAKRNSEQGLSQDPNAPSRRGVVDKNIVFSCNQTHHDPKTDGFADVDESVPPPFRIKVTTDTSEATLKSSADSRSTPSSSGLNASKNSRSTRRWPFTNQEQLLRVAMRGSNGSRGSDHALSADLDAAQSQLQWFGKDDQINNAHLFETVISMPSPRPALEIDVDVAIEDDLEDSDGPQYSSQKVGNKQQQQPQQEPQHPVDNHFPSRRAAAASKMATLTSSALPATDKPELQWIRSSTNPFFVDSSSTVDYDSMDPETAIEQTPLYPSDDLMTLAATEMTDLHLDDYTALGDASMPAPPPSTSGGWGGSRLLSASRSPPLGTSLGKDFLSLFAQH